MDVAGIRHVSLRVRNLESSAEFYCAVFGLRRQPARPASSRRCWCLSPNGGADGGAGLCIELIEGRPLRGASTIDHFAVEVRSSGAVVRLRRVAAERNCRTTSPITTVGRVHCFVFDPDGHKIEVCARRPFEPTPLLPFPALDQRLADDVP